MSGWFKAKIDPLTGPYGVQDTAHQIVSRRRRMVVWQFDQQRADHCENGELVSAAIAYLVTPGESLWPFDPEEFLPSVFPEENLVAAGALLAAEGDRIMRARAAGRPVSSGLVALGMEPEELTRCVDGLRNIQTEIRNLRDEHTEPC